MECTTACGCHNWSNGRGNEMRFTKENKMHFRYSWIRRAWCYQGRW